ncbi:sensor of ECF-type sigma factor [Flavobacterium luteum]|uniref:Sensor of ECF-type sigma factor n=1 Tax=Flavobacterium luteum TaxID=2026654 RepID=A0A7J5AJ89_9FLAO|nr:sensor of ECF-type sigma factor [Flavobacterium luteum]KAB1157646.1 sensor of ECF-type sigma factor [Flavobacterium luteum]
MKTKNLLYLFFILLTVNSFSQNRFKEKREKIKALKVAYITDELKLNSDEAAKFWPIYNAFDDKQRELKQEKMRSYMDRFNGGEVEKMSEKEALNFLNQMENTEEELFQLRKKFIINLKGILAPIKIIKLKKAEDDFNRKLLQQYRDKNNPK